MWIGSWVVGVGKCLGYKKQFFQKKKMKIKTLNEKKL